MIRILYIGPAAAEWAERTRSAQPSIDVAFERLPAAAVRNFEQTPPDAVVFCWLGADARLQKIVDAVRGRPLGELLPCVVIGSDEAERIDAAFAPDADISEILQGIAELIGVDLATDEGSNDERDSSTSQTPHHPLPAVETAARNDDERAPVDQAEVERKLREVRHESYFDVLGVGRDTDERQVREAFLALRRRYDEEIPADIERRFSAELDEVREALEDAYAVLVDDDLRAAHAEGTQAATR